MCCMQRSQAEKHHSCCQNSENRCQTKPADETFEKMETQVEGEKSLVTPTGETWPGRACRPCQTSQKPHSQKRTRNISLFKGNVCGGNLQTPGATGLDGRGGAVPATVQVSVQGPQCALAPLSPKASAGPCQLRAESLFLDLFQASLLIKQVLDNEASMPLCRI